MFGQHFFENSERFPGGSLRFFALSTIERGEKSNVHTAPEITNLKNHKEETQMKKIIALALCLIIGAVVLGAYGWYKSGSGTPGETSLTLAS